MDGDVRDVKSLGTGLEGKDGGEGGEMTRKGRLMRCGLPPAYPLLTFWFWSANEGFSHVDEN